MIKTIAYPVHKNQKNKKKHVQYRREPRGFTLCRARIVCFDLTSHCFGLRLVKPADGRLVDWNIMFNVVETTTYSEAVTRRIELVLSEAEVYGNWTAEDFVFHFEGLSEAEMVAWLDEVISEADSHLDGLM